MRLPEHQSRGYRTKSRLTRRITIRRPVSRTHNGTSQGLIERWRVHDGQLIYSAFTSLDSYVADETGNFDWAELGEEVHTFINNRERQNGTYLFGRKMYETMAVWETPDVIHNLPAAALEFVPIWQAAEKIVYSTTLQTVSTAKTRLERKFEADVVRELKARATRDVAVGGPALAAHAIRAGLVDEYNLLIAPVIAGGGNPYLPGKVRVKLELLDERRFDNGLVYVRYRAKI